VNLLPKIPLRQINQSLIVKFAYFSAYQFLWYIDFMVSYLFLTKSFTPEGDKSFEVDIKALLSLPKQSLNMLLDKLIDIIFPPNPDVHQKLREDIIANNAELKLSALDSSISVLRFFVMNYAKYPNKQAKNTPELWVEDLKTIFTIDKKQVDQLLSIFSKLSETILPDASKRYLEESAATGIFPFFTNIYFSVEMRPVQSNEYSEAMEVGSYRPAIVGTVTTASIKIETDGAENSELNFQATDVELNRIINSLNAALIEMREFKKYIGR
jgi:hypothetical protein